jgi:REP element-mobilizing transposase RayT
MRRVRRNVPGAVYHVISRFVDRSWFLQTREERDHYLTLLARALTSSDWVCLAYALMSSHIHLAMVAGASPLWNWAKRVHGPFARWMNQRHARLGPVFAHRPNDYSVPPSKVGEVIAYIHNNPVRAGVVARARNSDWTSHQAYLGAVEAPAWLAVDQGLARAGFEAAAVFDAWVDATPGDPCIVDLRRARIEAHRRGALEVATPNGGATPSIPLVARPYAYVRIDPRLLVQLAANAVGLSELELCSRGRTESIVAGRRIAVNAGLALGLTAAELAAVLAISRGAASQIARAGLDPQLQDMCRQVIDNVAMLVGTT